MRRFALLFSIFAVAFVVGLLVAPPSAHAFCHIYCEPDYNTTSTLTGVGCDCASAQADLEAQLEAAVSGECTSGPDQVGFCEKTLVYTTTCTCLGACDYRSEGYIKYRCKWCFDL